MFAFSVWHFGCHHGPFPHAAFSLWPQPILSPSILDHLINNDRKLPPEYNLPHTYVEMQVSKLGQAGGRVLPPEVCDGELDSVIGCTST